MEATLKIIYDEMCNGGDDTEHNKYTDGVRVTIVEWRSDVSWRARDHIAIQARVMIDREYVVDELVIKPIGAWNTDAFQQRQGIELFDTLVKRHKLVPDL